MEPFSNGLKYNPHTEELWICEHGRRGIGALSKDGKWRQVTKEMVVVSIKAKKYTEP